MGSGVGEGVGGGLGGITGGVVGVPGGTGLGVGWGVGGGVGLGVGWGVGGGDCAGYISYDKLMSPASFDKTLPEGHCGCVQTTSGYIIASHKQSN